MTNTEFNNITGYIGEIIKDSPFSGHVFAVGGSVRDLCMGNEIKDIDLVIDLQDGGIRFAVWCRDNGYTDRIVTYKRYGTAMFRFSAFPDDEIECVMTRGEVYPDSSSRNPVTSFAGIEADAVRRDFTINSLYYNVSTREILDFTGGREDIGRKIIRTSGKNPDVIYSDDPLRILRCVRMSCVFGFGIHGDTYESLKRNSKRLSIISKERIQSELNRILMSSNATEGVRMLHDIGAMEFIIPEFDKCFGLMQNKYHFGDVAEHTLAVLKWHCTHYAPSLTERLACLLHDIGKTETFSVKDGKVHFYDHESVGADMCQDILRRLRYGNKTIHETAFLIKNHMKTKNAGPGGDMIKDKTLNRILYSCGSLDRFASLMRVIDCDNNSHADEYCIPGQYQGLMDRVTSSVNHMSMFGYRLPVSGKDMMDTLGIGPGPVISEIGKRLMKMVFSDPSIDRNRCIRLLPGLLSQIEKNGKK